jgi:hypothetical protein
MRAQPAEAMRVTFSLDLLLFRAVSGRCRLWIGSRSRGCEAGCAGGDEGGRTRFYRHAEACRRTAGNR